MTDWKVIEGDCVDVLRRATPASVDAIVCDPPYGLEFMGKEWDRLGDVGQASHQGFDTEGNFKGFKLASYNASANVKCRRCRRWKWDYPERKCVCEPFGDFPNVRADQGRRMAEWHQAWATEALRVLKPGGHLLAFGGTRTYHRLACAIEDAGFEIRDSIANLSTPGHVLIDLLEAWIEWTERNAHVGLRLVGQGADSVPAPVLLGTSLERSPASALIAELRSSEARRTDAASWRSALSLAGEPSMELSALVTIAGNSPASPDAKSSTGSTAPDDALDWLDASTEARTRAVEALKIWRGSEQSSKRAATDALCAALTDALKVITCAQSETFRSYDTTLRTVCASATTATTTASTAAHLISFTADTLDPLGGDASEASTGPLLWIYGSGFPPSKSLDVSKAIDAAAGAERGRVAGGVGSKGGATYSANGGYVAGEALSSVAITPDAARWQGWGTALKPAHEPIVVARKPLTGTVAANVLEHGTGALNVDGCRIEGPPSGLKPYERNVEQRESQVANHAHVTFEDHPQGRWPANVILDPEAAAMLDEQTEGVVHGAGAAREAREGTHSGKRAEGWGNMGAPAPRFGDSGGASRFMYVAKASSAERSAGLDGKIGGCRCHEANTEASPPRATDEHDGTDDTRWSTSGSGSRPTDPSPTDSRSITETATSRTTTSPTSNSSPPPSTSDCIPPTTGETTPGSGSDGATSAANGSRPTPSTTTSAVKAGPSTDGADRATSHESSPTSSSAVCADCGGVIEGAWKNTHPLEPTVKPIDLMRWLVRLVTPPGGLVLDPFTGSGTTGCAAMLEGFRFVGIEREPEYAAIARARIAWWSEHPDGMELVDRLEAERARKAIADSGQLDIFSEA